MNLYILARFVVFIWLPIVTSELQDTDNYFWYKKVTAAVKHEENLVENISMEKNSFKMQKNKLFSFLTESNPSGNFKTKTSANWLDFESERSLHSEGKHASAHKLKSNIKEDLSALHRLKNISAIKLKSPVHSKRKSIKSKVRNRKAAIETSVAEDPHSPDDYEEEEADDVELANSTEIGSYVGAPCEVTCSKKLLHVFCDPRNKICECEDKYPVQIGPATGCEKPKLLGDQCFYAQTCSFSDVNSVCMQIDHNAMCQCKPGFHAVALKKGVRRMFCSEDVAVVSADLSTLLGVATGIAVLTGLICFVLRLFNGNRYSNTRHYANTNIAPPLLLSNDNQWINGIPLTVHGRTPSRTCCRRSTMSLAPHSRNKGVLVPASRAGAARAAAILLIPCHLQASRHSEVITSNNKDGTEVRLNDVEQTSRLGSRRQSFSSVQSNTSSQKSMSYSARRFEQENQQREQRAAIRAAKEGTMKSAASFTTSPVSTNGMIISFSKDTEEDPFCAHPQDPTPESEPPAFSVPQDIIAPQTSLN